MSRLQVKKKNPLSSTIFNLAVEPLIRIAKSSSSKGFSIYGSSIKTTAYADDIAVVSDSHADTQLTLNELQSVAKILGLSFNGRKCASLEFSKGKVLDDSLTMNSSLIRCLGSLGQESYLGVPIGVQSLYIAPTSLLPRLDKLRDSLLAPYQKLEVYRSYLLPCLCHHLASGRVAKNTLAALDLECRKFLKMITGLPHNAIDAFFYADRKVGELGTFRLSDDADVWTVARATQLPSSNPIVKSIFSAQLRDTARRGFNLEAPSILPISPYLSGSIEGGLYRLRFPPQALTFGPLPVRLQNALKFRSI